jgi:methylated-DNA-[protein]-cysteine S-methyltransferase
MLETYTARMAAPYAVLGVRTRGEWLTGIDYLPVGAPTLAPLDAFAQEVCRQLFAYLEDPDFRFDLRYIEIKRWLLRHEGVKGLQ